MFYQIKGPFATFKRVIDAFWQKQQNAGHSSSLNFTYERGVTEIHFPNQAEEERLFLQIAQDLEIEVTVTPSRLLF